MTFKIHNPGCACCEPCDIFSDTFTRADSSTPGTDWTEDSGDWDITSNALTISATTGGVITCNTLHPAGQARVYITCQIKATNGGDIARIIADYQDSANFHFGQIVFGVGGSISVNQRVAGVDTVLDSTAVISLTTGAFADFALCLDEADGQFRLTHGTSNDAVSSFTPFGSGQFGLGTGGTVAGTLTFDNFDADKSGFGCARCTVECTACTSGTTPRQMAVTLTGFSCTGLNGTYVLEQDLNGGSRGCAYLLDFSSTCPQDQLGVIIGSANEYTVNLRNTTGAGAPGPLSQWVDSTTPNPKSCLVVNHASWTSTAINTTGQVSITAIT